LYDLRDDPNSPGDPESHFGLMRRDLSAKPAFVAYAYLSHLLTGARYVSADWVGRRGFYAFRFRTRDAAVAVVWNASDITRPMTLRWPYPQANLINAGGDVLAQLTPDSGTVTITAPQGGEPFYLVDRLPGYRLPSLGPLLVAPRPRPTPARHRHPTARRIRRVAPTGRREIAARKTPAFVRRSGDASARRKRGIHVRGRATPTPIPAPA
jgi:hypothetical protein